MTGSLFLCSGLEQILRSADSSRTNVLSIAGEFKASWLNWGFRNYSAEGTE